MRNPRKAQAHTASAARKSAKRAANRPKGANAFGSGNRYTKAPHSSGRSWFSHFNRQQSKKARAS